MLRKLFRSLISMKRQNYHIGVLGIDTSNTQIDPKGKISVCCLIEGKCELESDCFRTS